MYATAAATTNPSSLVNTSGSPVIPFGLSYTLVAANFSVYRR